MRKSGIDPFLLGLLLLALVFEFHSFHFSLPLMICPACAGHDMHGPPRRRRGDLCVGHQVRLVKARMDVYAHVFIYPYTFLYPFHLYLDLYRYFYPAMLNAPLSPNPPPPPPIPVFSVFSVFSVFP